MKVIDHAQGKDWVLYNADCMEVLSGMPDNSIDAAVYSPPYSNLYCYGDSERDLGNCGTDEEFYKQYAFIVQQLHRVMRPGRIVCLDCKDLVDYAGSAATGMAGLRDFPGNLIRIHKDAGFSWHSRVTVWRDPVTEMQKTKAHGLLYKQLRADSTFSRMGLPMYVLMFRKWALDDTSDAEIKPVKHTQQEFTLEQWQRWASPVWSDIDFTRVLNVRAAREDKDEKHLAPMPLDVIERCLTLYSNPGDVVLSPFAGIGSEGYAALQMGRRFVGVELKGSYFSQAVRYLTEAANVKQGDLFAQQPAGT